MNRGKQAPMGIQACLARNCQLMAAFGTAATQNTPTPGGLHSGAKTANTDALALGSFEGASHGRRWILKIKSIAKVKLIQYK